MLQKGFFDKAPASALFTEGSLQEQIRKILSSNCYWFKFMLTKSDCSYLTCVGRIILKC